ncbi:MAG: hypothetical protein AAGJ32_06150 [Pseudomonadota bacterium]
MTVAAWMIDLIFLLILAEALIGAIWLARSGRRALIGGFLWFLASGAALMFAIRLLLTGETGGALAAMLLCSFLFHFLALASVWRAAK